MYFIVTVWNALMNTQTFLRTEYSYVQLNYLESTGLAVLATTKYLPYSDHSDA